MRHWSQKSALIQPRVSVGKGLISEMFKHRKNCRPTHRESDSMHVSVGTYFEFVTQTFLTQKLLEAYTFTIFSYKCTTCVSVGTYGSSISAKCQQHELKLVKICSGPVEVRRGPYESAVLRRWYDRLGGDVRLRRR